MSRIAGPNATDLTDIRQTVLDFTRAKSRLDSATDALGKLTTQKADLGSELDAVTERWESLAHQTDVLSMKGETAKLEELTPELFSAADKRKDLRNKLLDAGREFKKMSALKDKAESRLKDLQAKLAQHSKQFPEATTKLSEAPHAYDEQLGKSGANHGETGVPERKIYLQIDAMSAIPRGTIIESYTEAATADECMLQCDKNSDCNSFLFGKYEDELWCGLSTYSWSDGSDIQQHMLSRSKFKTYYVITEDHWNGLKAKHKSIVADDETVIERAYAKPSKKKWDVCAFGAVLWLSLIESIDVQGCQRACDATEACTSILFAKVSGIKKEEGLCITTTGRENDYTRFFDSGEESQASKCTILQGWDGSKLAEKEGEMGVYFVPEHHLRLESIVESSEDRTQNRSDEQLGLYRRFEQRGKEHGCPNFAWWDSQIKATTQFYLEHCKEACDVTPDCHSFMWYRRTCIMMQHKFETKDNFFHEHQLTGVDVCEMVEIYYADQHASSVHIWNLAHVKHEVAYVPNRSLSRRVEQSIHPVTTFKDCVEKTRGDEISRMEGLTHQQCQQSCKRGECEDFLYFEDGACITYVRKLIPQQIRCIFGKSMFESGGLWNERPYHMIPGCWSEKTMRDQMRKSWWDLKLDVLEKNDVTTCKQSCSRTYSCFAVVYYAAEKACILLGLTDQDLNDAHMTWDKFNPNKFGQDRRGLCAEVETHYVLSGTYEMPQNGQCCKYVYGKACVDKSYGDQKAKYCPIHTTVWWEYPTIFSRHKLDGNNFFKKEMKFECPMIASLHNVPVETLARPFDCSPAQVAHETSNCILINGATDCGHRSIKKFKTGCETTKTRFGLSASQHKNTGVCQYGLYDVV